MKKLAQSPRLKSRRRGMVLVYTVISFMTICAFISLAVDLGRVTLAKSELTYSVESAARYAVTGLVSGTAVSKAQSIANTYSVDGGTVSLQSSDIEVGKWDSSAKTFTVTSVAPNAVRVTGHKMNSRGTAVQLTFARVLGAKSCDVSAQTIAYYNKNILLVVNTVSPLAATDQLTYNHLVAAGYNVVVDTDLNVTASSAADYRLVVISETIVSGNINTKLRDVAVPVIDYEPFIVDDMGCTGPTQDTDFGLSTVGDKITITSPGDPIAAGLTGTVTITTLPSTVTGGALAWGVPSGGGKKIASINGESTHAAVYAWDTGSLLANGTPAAARRVMLWGSGPLGTFTDGAPASSWNANGWKIFDAAVTWCLGSNPTIKTVK